MDIALLPLSRLRAAFDPDNPNEVEDAAQARLTGSIQKFGVLELPVLNIRAPERLIAGHHRVEAAETNQLAEIPTILVDFEPADAEAAALALNAQYGAFNLKKLRAKLQQLIKQDYDLDETFLAPFTREDAFKEEPRWNPRDEDLDTFLDNHKTHTCPRCGHEFRDA